jgi:hypothetical protein
MPARPCGGRGATICLCKSRAGRASAAGAERWGCCAPAGFQVRAGGAADACEFVDGSARDGDTFEGGPFEDCWPWLLGVKRCHPGSCLVACERGAAVGVVTGALLLGLFWGAEPCGVVGRCASENFFQVPEALGAGGAFGCGCAGLAVRGCAGDGLVALGLSAGCSEIWG